MCPYRYIICYLTFFQVYLRYKPYQSQYINKTQKTNQNKDKSNSRNLQTDKKLSAQQQWWQKKSNSSHHNSAKPPKQSTDSDIQQDGQYSTVQHHTGSGKIKHEQIKSAKDTNVFPIQNTQGVKDTEQKPGYGKKLRGSKPSIRTKSRKSNSIKKKGNQI